MKKLALFTSSIIAFAYIGLCLTLYFNQENFIYFPTPHVNHDFESLTIRHDGESINLTVLNAGKEKAIVYFGGNAEATVYNAPSFSETFPSHTVYLFNYRGYGKSTGSPSEEKIYADAQALIDQISKVHKGISVIGRSLGSGVATYIASRNKISQLVLITPFDSIKNIAQNHHTQ